ncbi:MAG: FMN-dependent NADH-azoreductase, partial [Pseudonocardiaceae bacterium]
QTFRAAWLQAHPNGEVIHRDLGREPVPPPPEDAIIAGFIPAVDRTAEQVAAFEPRERLIREFLDADAYLFTVPMYNWSIPALFKAWLDQILLVGDTVNLDGLSPVAGRPATAILSFGGGYGPGTPKESWNFLEPYLRRVLGEALGLDLAVIKAELTMAERIPALAELVPTAKRQRAEAHLAAQARARAVAAHLAA